MPKRCAAPRKSHAAFHHAQKGLQRRRVVRPPARCRCAAGFGSNEFDAEGRYLEADFGKLTVISVYLAVRVELAGSPARQVPLSRPVSAASRARCATPDAKSILCGDWNIAHQPIDLKNWRSNQKNSGFLPEERAWLTRVFDELGFVDVFRRINKRARSIHLVVEPRPGVGEERRLAHRLPDRDGRHRRDRARRRRSTRTGDFPITRR